MLPTALGPLACVILCTSITLNSLAIFFPVLFFILFFSFLLINGVLGVGALLLGSWIGLFVVEGFQLMGLRHLE